MSAKNAQDQTGLIIHVVSSCGNFRTGGAQCSAQEGLQDSTLAARFWSKVAIKSPSECWPWLACLVDGSYGYIRINGEPFVAHRVAWMLANGCEIPDGLVIRHSCDRPLCCNPAHLIPGTQQDNVNDRVARGRSARGEACGRRKLTADQAHAIRVASTWKDGAALAVQFGLTKHAASDIRNGRSWASLQRTA